MIDEPFLVVQADFQRAWAEAAKLLSRSSWEVNNLVVQIRNPQQFASSLHERVSEFAVRHELLGPRHVAYTVFPQGLYRPGNREQLFELYNRPNGLYDRLHRRRQDWGTYFRRMTRYDSDEGPVNQLANIIEAIENRSTVSKAAYTIVIERPGGETIRPRGAPCLNYIAVQLHRSSDVRIGLLAVYRNHDFLERAYGNYWGICNLVQFFCSELELEPGPVTCVSSHAYVSGNKTALRAFLDDL